MIENRDEVSLPTGLQGEHFVVQRSTYQRAVIALRTTSGTVRKIADSVGVSIGVILGVSRLLAGNAQTKKHTYLREIGWNFDRED